MNTRNIKKDYHHTTDYEKFIIKEYKSWAKSNAPIAYKIDQLNYWRCRAGKENLLHLL